MANSSWFKKTPWNNGGRHDSILFKGCRWQEPRGLNLDIDGWLRRIGLTQYAEMFRANDVDGELLRRMTNDDLKDVGVVSFGHRKKLLEAIAELGVHLRSHPRHPPCRR